MWTCRLSPPTALGAVSPIYLYGDPSLRVDLHTRGDNEFASFGDRAVRIAAAGRMGNFDLFGAYAFRERDNYFSGMCEPGYYQQEDLPHNSDTYVRRQGLNYEPGNEIPIHRASWNRSCSRRPGGSPTISISSWGSASAGRNSAKSCPRA